MTSDAHIREKLIDIIVSADISLFGTGKPYAEVYADHLIAEGVTIQEWTPVSDPPKERGDYLCYFKFEPDSPDVICQNTYIGTGHWLSEESRVTRWMPLPELPEEDTSNA